MNNATYAYAIKFNTQCFNTQCQLGSIIDWCLLNFLEHDQYHFDPVSWTSVTEWVFYTNNETYAAMFIMKWT
jgi:hypothetical protein